MAAVLYVNSEDGTKCFQPVLQDGVSWATKRTGTPGKLTFKVIPDSILDFSEGSAVQFTDNEDKIFFGFVFKRERSKDGIISVTAYDQIRYLKNKDTKIYTAKKAGQVVEMLAADLRLNLGEIEDTGYVIPKRTQPNTTFLDMIEDALALTLQNTKELFVLYDDFGKLTLKNIANMKVGSGETFLMIDEETGRDFDYVTSIDDQTYNKIKLSYENEKAGKREIYIAQSGENMNRWGVLQYFDTLKKGENGQAKADALLSLYNKKTRKLKINDCFGDNRVRAGSMVVVNLKLDDMSVQNFMVVEECTHTYKENEHTMDLTLRGGEFIA